MINNETSNPLHSSVARAAQSRAQRLRETAQPLDNQVLNQLFLEARSHNAWLPHPVSDADIERLYELLRWGSTSMNCSPARFVFLRSDSAKQRLLPALMPANRDKVLTAPVTAIIAHDEAFYRELPRLFPHQDNRALFADNAKLTHDTAFRNGTLQGAYLMLAARALALDCGPLSGFDNAAVDNEFFPDSTVHSNFLCCLGYGDHKRVFQRLPRLEFNEACQLI